MSDEEFEEEIDKMYDEMFQKQSEMEELGLINYGDMSYYLQHPEEYEKDSKICELESEVIRLEHKLEISEKALELACEDINSLYRNKTLKAQTKLVLTVEPFGFRTLKEHFKQCAKEKNENV